MQYNYFLQSVSCFIAHIIHLISMQNYHRHLFIYIKLSAQKSSFLWWGALSWVFKLIHQEFSDPRFYDIWFCAASTHPLSWKFSHKCRKPPNDLPQCGISCDKVYPPFHKYCRHIKVFREHPCWQFLSSLSWSVHQDLASCKLWLCNNCCNWLLHSPKTK